MRFSLLFVLYWHLASIRGFRLVFLCDPLLLQVTTSSTPKVARFKFYRVWQSWK